MRKVIKNIILISVSVILVTFFLYRRSMPASGRKNGFERTFSKGRVVQTGRLALPDKYSIAFLDQDSLVLFASLHPSRLLKLPVNLSSSKPFNLPFPTDMEKVKGINSIFFDGNDAYLLNGRTAKMYTVRNKKIEDDKRIDSIPFSHSDMMSAAGFVVASRTQEQGSLRRIIKKINASGSLRADYLPEKQVDGYFCNDGQFKYDPRSKALIYMFFYRGSFTCLDSNLKVKYIAKTIDTITRASITIDRKATEAGGHKLERITTTKPPVIINRRLCAANRKVFIISAVKADNEDEREFRQVQVVDVYDINDGKYLSSFYLPRINRSKIYQFKVYENMLAAVYKNELLTFKIPEM